jgi:dTDP-4-dehydrorhamnose reductase
MKILILGANGMLGHKVLEYLTNTGKYEVWGTVLEMGPVPRAALEKYSEHIIQNINALDTAAISKVITDLRPDFVVNCIGIIKQNDQSKDWLLMLKLNAVLPQELAKICDSVNAKMITVATDCVFDGQKGSPYLETDLPTCHDAYGMTKYLGEVHYGSHLTLRTSIIGHEIWSKLSLLDWFLNEQSPKVKGYTKAIYSGVTTLEFAKFLDEYVFPNKELCGLYHLSVNEITKYDLLKLVAQVYHKNVEFIPDDHVNVDRALDSSLLRAKVGYKVKPWPTLVEELYADHEKSLFYPHK